MQRLAARPRGLVFMYGRAGLRPPWFPNGVRLVPVMRGGRGRRSGKYEIVYADPGHWRQPLYCRVVPSPHPDYIVDARRLYGTWHAGLVELLGLLPALKDREATGPAAPAAPWEKA
jgi:hypothetical protein